MQTICLDCAYACMQDNGLVNVLEWTSTQQSMSSAPLGSAVTVPSGPLATSRMRSQTGS